MDKIKKLNAQESMGNCSSQSLSSGLPTVVIQEDEPQGHSTSNAKTQNMDANKGYTSGTSEKRFVNIR